MTVPYLKYQKMKGFLMLFGCITLIQAQASFFELDPELKRLHRKLLQENEEDDNVRKNDDGDDDSIKDGTEKIHGKKEEVKERLPQSGPLNFYDGQNFAMTVTNPILVSVFTHEGEERAQIKLDAAATSVKGSIIKAEERYLVNLDWKGSNFEDSGLTLKTIFLTMEFVRNNKEYKLVKMDAENIRVGSDEIISNPLSVTTNEGYAIKAPLGTSFCCSKLGMFTPPSNTSSESSQYRVGISLPGIRLQVFKIPSKGFGPEWDCAYLFSIGVWVSLILSLGFAIVCWWGFSMLAGIQTMDRFDDPKGKPIHIPATD